MPKVGRLEQVAWRLAVLASVVTLLGVWIYLVRSEVLPDSGPGWLSYRLHDYVYLPLKGWLFHYPYPYSVAAWLLVSTTVVATVGSLVLDRSFILFPHRALLHWLFVLNLPLFERLTTQATTWLSRLGLESRLYRQALHHEQLLAAERLLRAPKGKRQTAHCRQLARLTNWWVRVESAFPNITPVALLSTWHWAYVLLLTELTYAERGGQSVRSIEKANTALHDTLEMVLRRSHGPHEGLVRELETRETLFSAEALGRDVYWLFSARPLTAGRSAAEPLFGVSETLQAHSVSWPAGHVANRVDQRRVALHALALHAMRGSGDASLGTGQYRVHYESTLSVDPYAWQLALSVALHAALELQIYRLGTAFFEAQDAAIFALSLPDGHDPTLTKDWQALVSSYPHQQHYLAAGHVRCLALELEEATLEQLSAWDSDLLDTSDRTLARLSTYAMFGAAGPNEGQEELL